MAYRVVLLPAAQRELDRVPARAFERIKDRLLALAEDPRPHGALKLAGVEGVYRVRVGDYRILFQVEDDTLLVVVVRLGHRRDVYRVRDAGDEALRYASQA